MRVLVVLFSLIVIAVGVGCVVFQRRLLYFPSHHGESNGLVVWTHEDRVLGYCRSVEAPRNVWLMLHGNAGQAADRAYALPAFSAGDAVFVLEYPGYGARGGSPSMASFNRAAVEAYELLCQKFPNTSVCVMAESIGSGPACTLTTLPRPPAKLVLVVPFDTLASVASDHYPLLPVGLILRDKWDNIAALATYNGPLEVFGARDDRVIPIVHARALAASRPQAVFHEIDGGHNEWARPGRVVIRNP